MAGRAMIPRLTVAAPDTPAIAAISAQITTVPIPSPPGKRPISLWIISKRSSVMPERCSTSPMKMNIGSATSRKLSIAL